MAWEIYSDGEEPYNGKSLAEVRQAVAVDQYRLTFRETVPSEVSDFFTRYVWTQDPNHRPLMPTVVQKLEHLYGITQSPAMQK